MPEELTHQELIYIAHALRVSAGVSEANGADPKFQACKSAFEAAARGQRELAEKGERIVKRMR